MLLISLFFSDSTTVEKIVYQPILRSDNDIGFQFGEELNLKLDDKGTKLEEDFIQV